MVDASSTFMVPSGERNRSGLNGLMSTIGQGQQQLFNVTLHRSNNMSIHHQNSSKHIRKMAPNEEAKTIGDAHPELRNHRPAGMTIQDNTFYSPKVG